MRAKDAVGRYGEDVAARYLVGAGMVILDRNWRCSQGEIDIVARDGVDLVVCEVKTRRGTGFGSPVEAVTPHKAARLRQLAALWVAAHPVRPREVRLDVVGVLRGAKGPAEIEHLRGVA